MLKLKQKIKKDKEYIIGKILQQVEIGIILGSGMTDISPYLQQKGIIPYYEMPNFPGAKNNQEGKLIFGGWQGKEIIVFLPRLHFYQGCSYEEVCYPVWLLEELGGKILASVNTAGALSNSLEVGDIMLVKDQLNLMGGNPLLSIPQEERNPQFLDLSAAYDSDLRQSCHRAASELKMPIKEGILAAVSGPCYETPAEARMLSILGADAVCMSTIPEVIIANYLDLRVIGLSLITNKSAAKGGGKISHESVLTIAARFQQKIYQLLSKLWGII